MILRSVRNLCEKVVRGRLQELLSELTNMRRWQMQICVNDISILLQISVVLLQFWQIEPVVVPALGLRPLSVGDPP